MRDARIGQGTTCDNISQSCLFMSEPFSQEKSEGVISEEGVDFRRGACRSRQPVGKGLEGDLAAWGPLGLKSSLQSKDQRVGRLCGGCISDAPRIEERNRINAQYAPRELWPGVQV